MWTEVWDLCRRESLFFPGCRVLCAVSGGPDSVALLLLLKEHQTQLGIQTLACAHYDHGLRGEESRRDAEFTRKLADRLELPFYLGSGDVAAQAKARGKGLEEAGRELRYKFLENIAGFDCIATAHTGDDNLETVLLHFLRGSSLRGLCGIPPKRGRIVRPLLGVSRQQVLDYLHRRGQAYCWDRSNECDQFARNRLRRQVLPALKRENPGLIPLMDENLTLLREDASFLDQLARQQAERLLRREKNQVSCPRGQLLELPRPLRLRLLREMAAEITSQVLSARQIRAIEALAERENPSGRLDLPGAQAVRSYDWIELRTCRPRQVLETVTFPPGEVAFAYGKWLVSCKFVEKSEEFFHSVHTFTINYDIIKGDLVLRARCPGDRIRLPGRVGSRLLSDLMIDQKIPRAERDLIPVLADGSGILAVYGFGAREGSTPEKGQKALRIQFAEKLQKNRGGHRQ